ncbi:sialic acid-binding Ig-like lectin 5 [Pagrus major]|uniref:sialic acid-binding Ig-like lectin 5 n=1 Tax=Pagrus major TaxID=143350 RepID=UPI003CC8597C
MFPLIWMTLLFTVRSNHANTVTSPGATPEISAEAGLCVVIPCNVTTDSRFNLKSAAWYKCEQNCADSDIKLRFNDTNSNAQPGSRGRVSLLEPNLSQNNCSIIINDLTGSDSGLYQLRVLNETFHRATITVQDLIQKPTVMIPSLTDGQQITLTCTAPGLCSGSYPTITWTWRGRGEKGSHITGNITAVKTENVTAITQRHSSTLTFNSSAEHHGTSVTCKVSFTGNMTMEETVTLNVTYVKKPEITGRTTVKQGDTLNLTCSAESFPLASVIWTQVPSNKNLPSETETDQQNNTGTATLVFPNVTTEHTGQYTCTAKHLNTTLTVYANVNVTLYPKILNSSGCTTQSEILTCMCISQGFPLPTITWPLLQHHTKFTVITTISNNTINSTITLTVKERSNTGVECVSRSENREVKGKLIIIEVEKEGQIKELVRIVTSLEHVIVFLIGALVSAIICCLVRKCHRNKRRTYGNQADTLEMVTILEDQLINAGPAVEVDQAIDQETAEAGEAGAVGKSDVEYSNLDFSLIKRQTPAEAGATQGKAETEYAEIKREKGKERKDGEDNVEEEMDEEAKHGVQDEEESDDVAVYSTVKELMDEIEG